MEIRLNTEEIAAILTNWAKQKYKTHNVFSDIFKGEANEIAADITITLTPDQISDTHQDSSALIKGLKRHVDEQPDFSGAFESMVAPLA